MAKVSNTAAFIKITLGLLICFALAWAFIDWGSQKMRRGFLFADVMLQPTEVLLKNRGNTDWPAGGTLILGRPLSDIRATLPAMPAGMQIGVPYTQFPALKERIGESIEVRIVNLQMEGYAPRAFTHQEPVRLHLQRGAQGVQLP